MLKPFTARSSPVPFLKRGYEVKLSTLPRESNLKTVLVFLMQINHALLYYCRSLTPASSHNRGMDGYLAVG